MVKYFVTKMHWLLFHLRQLLYHVGIIYTWKCFVGYHYDSIMLETFIPRSVLWDIIITVSCWEHLYLEMFCGAPLWQCHVGNIYTWNCFVRYHYDSIMWCFVRALWFCCHIKSEQLHQANTSTSKPYWNSRIFTSWRSGADNRLAFPWLIVSCVLSACWWITARRRRSCFQNLFLHVLWQCHCYETIELN